jgi:hypothetical protein
MSIISNSISALGKLAIVGVLLAAFFGGMAVVVVMSLSGSEIRVPEIVGKDFVQSEKELAALGLKIRKRADRVSTEQMNTVLEQLPKAGETVKSGQWISVVVSKAGLTSEETPSSLIKDLETDDSEKIEEMISDKPKKKTNSNTNKKKAETTRDVIANESSSNTGTDTKTAPDSKSKAEDTDKKDTDKPKEAPSVTQPKTQSTPGKQPFNEPPLRR